MMLLGPIGIGKSSIAAQFPKPLFLYDELDRGCLELYNHDLITAAIIDKPYKTFDDLMMLLYQIINADGLQYKTIVLDGLTGLQRVMFDKALKNLYKGEVSKFLSFQDGPKTVITHKDYLPEFLNAVERLRDKGVHFLITGHSDSKTKDSSLAGKAYEREIPVCDRMVFAALAKTPELVGYMLCVPQLAGDGKSKRVGSESDRTLFAHQTPYVEAKNRFGCNHIIPFCGTPKENFTDMCRAFRLDPLTLQKKAY